MKNKKGFTFVELIAVIMIIGILTLVALPTIEKLMKTNKENIYQQQLDNIVLSLKSWASDNRIYLPEEENETLVITLGNLKSDGYIEYEVKNPLTGKCFDNGIKLIITKVKKNYDYSIDLNTIRESNNCEVSLDSPVIALNGDTIENIEANSVYVDKGVIAKDKDDNNITDEVITIISGSGNAIDTSKIGNSYIINYSVTSNGKTAETSRTVKIVDTTPPEITIPGNVFLDTSITSFDIMEGVTVTDNSGEEINISTTGNIKFGNVGKYTITYKATDSSKNTITKKRIVTINKNVNGIMASNSNCIKETTMICPNGTEISVQVNATQTYDFYVIKDTGTKLTLIMDGNLGDDVEWDDCLDSCPELDGPLTALRELKERTYDWSNIYTYSYELDYGRSRTYSGEYVQNVRTRMPARSDFNYEFESIPDDYAKNYQCQQGDSNCPTWLEGNFWLSDLYIFGNNPTAQSFNAYEFENDYYFSILADRIFYKNGLRPVIELSK